ncbi:hypothetical protein Lesp02_26070 [Lentzea sp. NBRC 105346]|nr:hypothetical protein Lesp02_26070 [Lentzea sp. NBRC 105346]
MQRPATTGRRHTRAGSISVAELIKQQPVRIPSPDEAATETLVLDLLGPREEGRRRRKPKGRAAKAFGLATGAVVLFSSIAAAAFLAGNRPANTGVPYTERPVALSGASALRPDVLSAKLPGDRQQPAPTSQLLPAPQLVKEPATTQPTDIATPLVLPGPQPRIEVVRRFYELLTTAPGSATKLLSPDLVGADPEEFVRSWGMIQTVNVDQTVLRQDGSVLAVVSMQERDGSWLRLEQLFWLTDTSTPRIIGTEVLSAQRS